MSKGATRKKPKRTKLQLVQIRRWVQPIVVAVFACGSMGAAGFLVLEWVNRDITQLKIVAPIAQVSESEIRQQLSTHFPSSFFYLDVIDVREQLKKLPMVREASVKKVWPDTLEITLQEEIPVASWNSDAVLSHAGDILPVTVKDAQLPKLEGAVGNSHTVMKHFHLFSSWGKTHQLELMGLKKNGTDWQLRTKAGIQIWIDQEDALQGLKRLGAVLNRVEIDRVSGIDLRYEQGFAVAWKLDSQNETVNEENVL